MQIIAKCLLLCMLGLPLALARISALLPQENPAGKVEGKALFEDHCSVCHGLTGEGGRGPNLHTPKLKHAKDEKGIRSVIANGVPPAMPEAWYLSDEEIANLAGYVKSLGTIPPEKVPGDAGAGAQVYAQSGCSMCHILGAKGQGFGPDLSEVGARRGAARLMRTLKNPEANLPEDFLLVEATPREGRSVGGVRLNEDTFSIQLRDMAGRIYSFRKTELTSLKKLRGETPMPSYDSLSAKELENLVAYLAAQRGEE
jgi:cytochrome c oxidase cbb3-type subunit III